MKEQPLSPEVLAQVAALMRADAERGPTPERTFTLPKAEQSEPKMLTFRLSKKP